MILVVMHMKQFVVCIAILAVGCSAESGSVNSPSTTPDSLTEVAPGKHSSSASRADAELSEILTTGGWVRDLGTGPFLEQWVYHFYKDGTYTQQIVSDFESAPVQGKWKLTRLDDASERLTLFGLESGNYYWLGEESFVRYDRETDSLVVTGPRYDGEQALRHEIQE